MQERLKWVFVERERKRWEGWAAGRRSPDLQDPLSCDHDGVVAPPGHQGGVKGDGQGRGVVQEDDVAAVRCLQEGCGAQTGVHALPCGGEATGVM